MDRNHNHHALILALLLICGLWAEPSWASFTHAQATATAFLDATSLGTLNVVLTNNPASGDTVIVAVCLFYNSQTTPPTSMTVVDANSNSYTLSANSPGNADSANSGFVYLFYLTSAPANASKTITATWTSMASTYISLFADDFTVSGGAVSVDADGQGAGGSGSTINTPTVTVNGSAELLYSAAMCENQISSVNSPWTQSGIHTANGSGAGYILSANSSTALNMTQNVTTTWSSMGISFKQAAGGGATSAGAKYKKAKLNLLL